MKFPQDIWRFLYLIFFKPISFHTYINQLDRTIGNVTSILRYSHDKSIQSIKNLVLFYVLVMPWLLGFGTGMLLSQLGMNVNWLKLAFYLLIAIAVSLNFSIDFSIAFLLPFSILIAIWNSIAFTSALGIVFSLLLGLAYGLSANSARWGLTAGLVYGVVFGLILGPLSGLTIGAAFLIGYFRIFFYLVEAPLSWILGTLADRDNALQLWHFQPVLWDELIWFPLPGLDKHLRAIKRQNESASQAAILYVQKSFRQRWAADQILDPE